MIQEALSKIRPLSPPETGLTPEILVERARALRPLLREQQAQNDKAGRYSEELHQAFREAGFYRIMQPKIFGGYQMDPSVFLRVVMEIARGHPAAGWCFCLGGSHAFFIAAHYPIEVQAELFGDDGEFRSAQVVFPGPGTSMTPVEGGYVIDGVWPFASGIPISTHFIGGGLVFREGGPPEHRFFTVPVSQIEILPDWGGDRFMGMQASGSNSVKLTKVFVPERFTIIADMLTSSEPFPEGSRGYLAHGDPMYMGVLVGWFHCEFAAILSGTARAALEDFAEQAKTKPILSDPSRKRREDPFVQNVYGRALGLADAAEALTLATIGRLAEINRAAARDKTAITLEQTLTVWGMARQACVMACDAVDLCFHNVGATVGRSDQKLQRYYRDIEMYRVHIQSQPALPTLRGQVELGAPGKRGM
jgi:3-hydroxy-9,10-secoandrosta-1,3,5(10)-triene-9,17-dione monooxygenase